MPRETFRKVITSKEKIEAINVENKELVKRFLKNFATRRSSASVKVYESNFNIFFCWNLDNNENKPFISIRKREFMDFFDYSILELQWSPNRYAQMWSSLSSLSTFIENILDDDYPDFRNQVKKIEKVPKATVREKTILTDAQILNLLEYLSENDKQQACLLALGISSGARISELLRFDVDIIDLENTVYDGLFIETNKMIKTKGRGRSGKLIYKNILKSTFEKYYLEWIPLREEILKKNNVTHNSLFVKPNGSPIVISTARGWMKSWEKYLTELDPSNPEHTPVSFYAHSMRHFMCTYLSKIGLEQELIIELFGWAAESGGAMYATYNDMTNKERKWKSLDKLKNLNTDGEGKL